MWTPPAARNIGARLLAMIKVIDNLLTPSYAENLLLDARNAVQYFYRRETSTPNEPLFKDENTFDFGQFTCPIAVLPPEPTPAFSFYLNLIRPVIYSAMDKVPEIVISGIVRIKFNLLLQQKDAPESHYNIPHQDAVDSAYSMVYYCNDSDGDTFLFNEFFQSGRLPNKLTIAERVTPRKNRAVIFESNRYHASSNPRTSSERFVVNFIFRAHPR